LISGVFGFYIPYSGHSASRTSRRIPRNSYFVMLYSIACDSAKNHLFNWICIIWTPYRVSFLFHLIFQSQYLHTKGTHVLLFARTSHIRLATIGFQLFLSNNIRGSYECDRLGELQCQGLLITRYSKKLRKACRFKLQGQNLQQTSQAFVKQSTRLSTRYRM
jgi:hypothetical protein